MSRTAFRLSAVAAFGLTVLGVVLAFRGEPEPSAVGEPPMVIAEPDRDLGEVPVGPIDVVFDVTNPADRPRRIIGFAEG